LAFYVSQTNIYFKWIIVRRGQCRKPLKELKLALDLANESFDSDTGLVKFGWDHVSG